MESRKSFGYIALLMLGAALLISVIMVGFGVYRFASFGDPFLLAIGALGAVVTLGLIGVGLMGAPLPPPPEREIGQLNGLATQLRQATELLARISDQQLLSDRAKAVAFRDKDREALRRAIQEEINRGEWDASLRLVDEIESAFGYKAEAARFRDEIRARRQEVIRRQILEVTETIDRYTRTEQWNAALREAERLMAVYPDNDQVRGLPQEIDRRRQDHKRRLLESWQESLQRHDVDGSIEALKQLDSYLTPAEAAGMEDAVRGVFKEKREQLGRQFADAVHEHKWLESIRIGETIVREFPEARMAQEVKDKLPLLRQRAAEGGTAAGVVPPMSPVPAPAAVG